MSEKPKRILHIVGTMNLGGQETFIMNLYRKIDRSKIQFDFVVHSKEKQFYEEEIKQLGGRIYKIDSMSKNLFCHMKTLYHILKDNRYAIIHRHTNSSIIWFDLLVAKMAKVQKIIVHSHSSSSKSRIIHKICRSIMNLFIDIRLACSKEAGEWLFGKKKFTIIYNGIEMDKYLYSVETREKIRRKHYISSEQKVIGHVGRMENEKNQIFLIELVKEIVKIDSSIQLWLVGDGSEKEKLVKKVEEDNLTKNILFMGKRKDVNELLQAMDFFVFPSLYEGLGISCIEAQVAGLPCFISNKVPSIAVIGKNITVLPLIINEWTKKILETKKIENRKVEITKEMMKFNIKYAVEQIELVYGVKDK